ncbi:MAG: response regulator [Chloroflexi bacterium]|nr:response regulator [Chloroflexota bacterium]MBU1746875.1 response regulator [Chloroflexota bacterium]
MNERILVADDEEMVRYLLNNILTHQDYQVVSACDGQAAITQLEQDSFDLLLTDLKMPNVDGLELLRYSRARFPGTEVIMLTGHATVKTAVEAMKEGAYTYLTKPFNLEELLVTVRNCLQARALRLEKERLSELVSLLELGRTLTSNLDSQSLYDQIIAQVVQTFTPDFASIMLLDRGTEHLTLMTHWGLSDQVHVGDSLTITNSIAGQVVQTTDPILLFKDSLPSNLAPYARRPEIGSAMSVPLRYRDRTLGVLNVARRTDRAAYDHHALQLVTVFAVQAAIAVQNALLYRDLQTLEQASWQMTTIRDRPQIIRSAMDITLDVMQPEVVTLCLWDENGGTPQAFISATRPLSQPTLEDLEQRLVAQATLLVPSLLDAAPLRLIAPPETASPTAESQLAFTSFTSAPLLRGENAFGLLSCASIRPSAFDENSVRMLSTLASTIAIALQNAAAYQNLKVFNLQVIASLTTALEARDPYTRGHSERVSRFAVAIAHELGLSDQEIELLRTAGLLHDIGKVRVSDLILNKPGPLTEQEWERMKQHPVVGARIVEDVTSLRDIAPAIRFHHEDFDGRGYPEGLSGRNIPILARVLAVADSFEAMTANRAYRQGFALDKALTILNAGRGQQWDPHVVDIWYRVVEQSPDLLDFQPTMVLTDDDLD